MSLMLVTVKDGEAIIYQDLWPTGPSISAGAHLICGEP